MVSAGLELATAVAIGLAAGYLVDRFLAGERPLGMAFGALIGFGLGMVRFIIRAKRSTQQSVASPPGDPANSVNSSSDKLPDSSDEQPFTEV